jgi:DNA-binding transcriptional LysR family regulator
LLKKASILGLQARYNVSSEILLQLNIVAEMGSSEAVKEAVITGLGISVLSLHAVKREIEQGMIFPSLLPLANCSASLAL